MEDLMWRLSNKALVVILLIVLYFGFFDIKAAQDKKEASKKLSICVENAKTQADSCACVAKYNPKIPTL